MAEKERPEDLFDVLRKLSQSGRCRRLSLEIDGCQMEFRVGEESSHIALDYVKTGQVRGERQVAAFLQAQIKGS